MRSLSAAARSNSRASAAASISLSSSLRYSSVTYCVSSARPTAALEAAWAAASASIPARMPLRIVSGVIPCFWLYASCVLRRRRVSSTARCIESVTRRLAGMLELQIDLEDLRRQSDRLEEHVNRALEKHPDLKERIAQLEKHYDNDVLDTQMTDLKEWLERKRIRLD